MTLAEFLEARIAEDEAVARAVRPDEYLPTRDSAELADSAEGTYRWITVKSGRVLAECAAKRRIVAEHAVLANPFEQVDYCRMCVALNGFAADTPSTGQKFPCVTLKALALPYSTHPDFDPSWTIGGSP